MHKGGVRKSGVRKGGVLEDIVAQWETGAGFRAGPLTVLAGSSEPPHTGDMSPHSTIRPLKFCIFARILTQLRIGRNLPVSPVSAGLTSTRKTCGLHMSIVHQQGLQLGNVHEGTYENIKRSSSSGPLPQYGIGKDGIAHKAPTVRKDMAQARTAYTYGFLASLALPPSPPIPYGTRVQLGHSRVGGCPQLVHERAGRG